MSEALVARVSALEEKRFRAPKDTAVDEAMRRARHQVEALGLYSAHWKWVPEPYYTWELPQRAKVLGARSTSLLCKSLLLENKACEEVNSNKMDNPRFFMVMIQYEAELDTKKLTTSIRKMRPVESRLEVNKFDLQVASPEDNDRITGYAFNSVTPFGMKKPVPIYLSADIVPHGFFWMGGGHVHLKLGMSVADFQQLPMVKVLDLSVPRSK